MSLLAQNFANIILVIFFLLFLIYSIVNFPTNFIGGTVKYEVALRKRSRHSTYFLDASSVLFSVFVCLDEVVLVFNQDFELSFVGEMLGVIKLDIVGVDESPLLVLPPVDLLL